MERIAETIERKRKELGMSRDKLAWKAKVTPKSIMNIENGALPSVRVLAKVCDALDLKLSVIEKDIKRFNDIELSFIVDNIAEAVLNGDTYASFSIDDDIDIDISIDSEVSRHQENSYVNGTGTWIVDHCRIKIRAMDVGDTKCREIEMPDFAMLEVAAETKVRNS